MANQKIFSWKLDGLLIAIILGSMIFGAVNYGSLPEQVPSHWNFQGEVDGYSSRLWGAFGIPLLNAALFVAFLFIPRLDPRKEKYSLFTGPYKAFRLVLHLFFAALHVLVISAAKGAAVNFNLLMPMGIGILFITIGNYLGKVQWNYFMGIKTPWTLENETVWRKTHRMAGPLWVAAGLASFASALIDGEIGPIIFFASLAIATVVPMVYSFIIYKKITT